MTRTMTYDEFRKRVANGAIFTVKFIKRTDNTVREMNCRVGVKKYLKGGTLGYDPAKKNLMGVYDLRGVDPVPEGRFTDAYPGSEPGYKMINLEGLIELRFEKIVWDWDFKTMTFTERSPP